MTHLVGEEEIQLEDYQWFGHQQQGKTGSGGVGVFYKKLTVSCF